MKTNTFKVFFDLDNAAFDEDPRIEIARILRTIADKVEQLDPYTLNFYQTIWDLNGNDVGRYAIKPSK